MVPVVGPKCPLIAGLLLDNLQTTKVIGANFGISFDWSTGGLVKRFSSRESKFGFPIKCH